MKKNTKIGSKIRALRIIRNMTQSELSRKSNITQRNVCNYEIKDLPFTSVRNIKKICDVLGVSIDYIVDDTILEPSFIPEIKEMFTFISRMTNVELRSTREYCRALLNRETRL
jgi:transcriptional regulator with XRE-family HTH domain